jgi:hypothetical protein
MAACFGLRRFRLAAAGAVLLALISCAVSRPPTITLPAPPHPAERPGPYGTTYALYDPSLFGPDRPLAELVARYKLRLKEGKLKDARLLINKAQRRLELWVGRGMVKAYRIQLGRRPAGPKTRRGDFRTPEGRYFICAHRPSTFYLALWISYPNLDDARAGLGEGRITSRQYEEIAAALKKGECPPQETALGGLLLLHGQLPEHTAEVEREQRRRQEPLRPGLEPGDADPSTVRDFYDWTDGCAALFNPDIRELYELVPDGTPLRIVADGPVTAPSPR